MAVNAPVVRLFPRALPKLFDATFDGLCYLWEGQNHAGDVLMHVEQDNRFWMRQEQTLLTLLAGARARGDELDVMLIEQALEDGFQAEDKRKGGLRRTVDALIAILGRAADRIRRANGYAEQIWWLNKPARLKAVEQAELPCITCSGACECFDDPPGAA
jgi:hypothetical protein